MHKRESSPNNTEESKTIDEDVIIPIKLETDGHLCGFHFPSVSREVLDWEPLPKMMKTRPELRPSLCEEQFIQNFKLNWESHKSFVKDNVELIVEPFKVCVIKDLLEQGSILKDIIDDFNQIQWNKRSLDLYEFFQSVSLKNIELISIKIIYEFLKANVKEWIQKLTGLDLTDMSSTCSLYGDTDYLLVHDDQQEDRLIAFVLYFTGPREWLPHHGGALQLLGKDNNGQPSDPVRDIFPCNNQLVFFQVTNDSYHQVTEVLNKDDCRLSINGWFHSKTVPTYKPLEYAIPNYGLFSNKSTTPIEIDIDLDVWINSDYLNEDTTTYIQKHIEEESEISLHNYFKEEAFRDILENIRSDDIQWVKVGPPNRRQYEIAMEENIPAIILRFLRLFSSPQMYSLLKQYTDLDLKSMRYELQRWTPGCYSLLSDYDWSQKHELDLILYLDCSGSSSSVIIGGRTMYISMDEEIQQALITLDPEENNLNIVYRDTARITKYMTLTESKRLSYQDCWLEFVHEFLPNKTE